MRPIPIQENQEIKSIISPWALITMSILEETRSRNFFRTIHSYCLSPYFSPLASHLALFSASSRIFLAISRLSPRLSRKFLASCLLLYYSYVDFSLAVFLASRLFSRVSRVFLACFSPSSRLLSSVEKYRNFRSLNWEIYAGNVFLPVTCAVSSVCHESVLLETGKSNASSRL